MYLLSTHGYDKIYLNFKTKQQYTIQLILVSSQMFEMFVISNDLRSGGFIMTFLILSLLLSLACASFDPRPFPLRDFRSDSVRIALCFLRM